MWWGIIDQLQYLSFLLSNMLLYIFIRYFQVILHILYSHDNLQHIKNAPKKPQTKQMLIFPPKFFWITYFHAQHNITYSLKWISFLCFIQMPKLIFFCVFAIKILVTNGPISLVLTEKLFQNEIQDGGYMCIGIKSLPSVYLLLIISITRVLNI